MEIKLKNGDKLTVKDNATCAIAAAEISEGLARSAVAAKINGELCDLSAKLSNGDTLEIVTLKDREGLEVYRHTCAHVLAQAIKNIYPTCKLAIGPVIDSGFYYDIDFNTPITLDDFEKIETEMQKIINSKTAIERFELPKEEALKLMAKYGETYKVELINDLPEDAVISLRPDNAYTPAYSPLWQNPDDSTASRHFLPYYKSRKAHCSTAGI